MALRMLIKLKARISRLDNGRTFVDGKPRMYITVEGDHMNPLRVRITDEIEIALLQEKVTKPLDHPMTISILIGQEGWEQN